MSQLGFFGEPEPTARVRPGQRFAPSIVSSTAPCSEAVEHGKALMAQLVADVLATPRCAGDLATYAERHFVLIGQTKDSPYNAKHDLSDDPEACRDGWFCSTYHHAPVPDSPAFDHFLENGRGYTELIGCPWYRATFSWGVARAARRAFALSEKLGQPFTIDPAHGNIIVPDGYRPELGIDIGQMRRGARILQVAVVRSGDGSKEPAWYRADRRGHYEAIDFVHGVLSVYVEYDAAPTEPADIIPYAA